MNDALRAARIAAEAHVSGTSYSPARHQLALTGPDGEMLVMPGVVGGSSAGVKVWYRLEGDGSDGHHSDALVLLVEGTTGEEVLLDGGVITDMRTGALTGVAAQHLARPDSAVLGVVGAGAQARTQVLALVAALPTLRTVLISSRSDNRRDHCVQWLRGQLADAGADVEVDAVDSPRDAVAQADVVVAATTARAPVIDDRWVRSGTLVCGVGSHDPGAQEIDANTVGRAERVVVDTMRGGVDGAGDIAAAIDAGLIERSHVEELGSLLIGAAVGRTTAESVTVFKSVGFAAADIVAANMVVQLARRNDEGLRVDVHSH